MSLHRHAVPGPGESAPFHLESTWYLPAGPCRVWQALCNVPEWPTWWPGMAGSRFLAPNRGRDCTSDMTGEAAAGFPLPGTRAELLVRTPAGRGLAIGIELRCTHPPHAAQIAVSGDLRGTGLWRARDVDGATHVDIVWCVVTGSRLLRVLRPVGTLAHRTVMAAGAKGLKHQLAAGS